MSAAVGMTPSAEARNTHVAPAWVNSSTTATGISGTSRYGHPSPVSRKCLRRGPSGPACRFSAAETVDIEGLLHAMGGRSGSRGHDVAPHGRPFDTWGVLVTGPLRPSTEGSNDDPGMQL
jgi:hypothetical protein